MSATGTILVIVDPTAGAPQAAVDKAQVLATGYGSAVQLTLCESPGEAPSGMHRELAQDLLDTLSAPLVASGLRVESAIIRGEACHIALLEHVRASKPAMVIKGTHPHHFSSHLFFRSTDWHLIQDCPVPLMLCKHHAWAVSPVIMAAIDPSSGDFESSHLGPRILAVGFALTRLLKGSLHVVHAYKPASAVRAIGSPLKAGMAPALLPVESELQERERQYASVLEFVRRCEVHAQQLHVDMGDASSYLPSIAAEQQADIVVVGASGPGMLTPVLHEGVAARILDGLRSDLLVLRR